MNPNQITPLPNLDTCGRWEENSSLTYERMIQFATLIEDSVRVEVESVIPPGYFYIPYVGRYGVGSYSSKPKPKLFIEVDEKELDF